jgi:hypothetical protein
MQPARSDLRELRDRDSGGGEVPRGGGAQAQVDFSIFAHDLFWLLVNGKT